MSKISEQTLASILAHYCPRHTQNGRTPADDPNLWAIEDSFKQYFNSEAPSKKGKSKAPLVDPSTLLNPLIARTILLESNFSHLLSSTSAAFPEGRVLLTQALRYLITRYGLTAEYTLTERAVALLRDPRIINLLYANNQELIYQINQGINERKKEEETAKAEAALKDRLSHRYHFIPQNKSNNSKKKKSPSLGSTDLEDFKLKHATSALTSFLYYVEHPSEEVVMEQATEDLLRNFGEFVEEYDEDEVDVIRKVYKNCIEQKNHKWYFLNSIYAHYNKQGSLAVENLIRDLGRKKEKYLPNAVQIRSIDKLIHELKLVSETHVKMSQKTKNQAVGMMIGGFAFGMEIGMLVLENLALMSTLGPWWVLGFSLGACAVLGTGIALYFHSAHYDELEKHNRFAYFHKKNSETLPPAPRGWGTAIAKLGTVEEGVAAACLLATLGAFMVFDMISWGIAGGSYTSALPGLFFATVSPHIVLTVVAGLALFSACAWVASCLASAHYALDGKHTIEYYDTQKEQKEMREIINKETAAPLVYNWKSKLSHKLDIFTQGNDQDLMPNKGVQPVLQ